MRGLPNKERHFCLHRQEIFLTAHNKKHVSADIPSYYCLLALLIQGKKFISVVYDQARKGQFKR